MDTEQDLTQEYVLFYQPLIYDISKESVMEKILPNFPCDFFIQFRKKKREGRGSNPQHSPCGSATTNSKIETQISNLVCTTHFQNNLHQVRSKPNNLHQVHSKPNNLHQVHSKPNNLKAFESKKTKGPKQNNQNRLGSPTCMSEGGEPQY